MRIYYVEHGPVHFFGAADAAKVAARATAKTIGEDVRVSRFITPDDRETIIALANGEIDRDKNRAQIVYIARGKPPCSQSSVTSASQPNGKGDQA